MAAWLLAVVLGSAAGPALAKPPVVLSPGEVAQELEAGRSSVLDVRPSERYRRGHIPGALSLPSDSLPPDGAPGPVGRLLEEVALTGSEPVVLYADAEDRDAVAMAFLALESSGVAEVRLLDGGWEAWRRDGREVEQQESVPPVGSVFVPESSRVTHLTADQVEELIDADGATLVDARAGKGWGPFQPTGEFVAGHVPRALQFDFTSLLEDDGLWPDRERARELLAELGPRPGTRVDLEGLFVIYGDDPEDPRVALGYTLLRLAGIEAYVYRGGWSAWRADAGRPVVRIVDARELASLLEHGTGDDTQRLFPKLPIFDLRELRDWEVGHVPGAFPLSAVEFPRFFGLVIEHYWPGADPARDPMVLYCYGPDCIRSRVGMAVAARAGWRHIYWFRDGVAGWFDAGYSLETLDVGEVPWLERPADGR